MTNPDLSIVIVTYNSADNIAPLLSGIRKSIGKYSFEVTVIDNNSSDKSAQVASHHFLKPTVILNKENLGFAKAVNQGIKRSSGKYILILNPDTLFIGQALKSLLDFAQSTPLFGAVAPRLLNNDGKIQPSCFKFPTLTNAIKYYFLGCKYCYQKYNPGNSTTTVDVAAMAAFLIPKTVLDKVGLLDERFFMYYEDVEFCRRLHRAGLPVYYLPLAKVKHAHGASGHFVSHLKSPLLASAKTYYGSIYSALLNTVLWLGHKWQVILRGKRFRD